MAISWNEISSRAMSFSKKWKYERAEESEAQSFLNDFFDVFGVDRKRVATFEKKSQWEKLETDILTSYGKG